MTIAQIPILAPVSPQNRIQHAITLALSFDAPQPMRLTMPITHQTHSTTASSAQSRPIHDHILLCWGPCGGTKG